MKYTIVLTRYIEILFFLFISFSSIIQGVIIDFPGRYELGNDIYTNATDDAITITCNGVTLEMNAHGIIGGKHAIVVESGVQGVVIQNGFISNTAESAILVKDNTAIVQIRHMSIAGCQGPAIELAGTSTAAQVKNVFVEETAMYGCALAVTASTVFSANYAHNLAIRDSVINFSGNLSNTINVIEIKNSCATILLNLLLAECLGNVLRGVVIENSTHSIFEQVRLLDNMSTATFIGFLLTATSDDNGLCLCKVVTGSSDAGDVIGYDIGGGSSRNVMYHCQVSALEGENSYGFYVHGSGTPSDTEKNDIKECIILNNTARSGNACGVLISRADKSILCQNEISHQSAPSGVATGIEFASGTGGDEWTVCKNEIIQNVGSSNANSYGINVVTGNNNVFIKNMASENGATSANQLAGVSANSVSLVSQDLINTVTLPWTNIGVTA